ncbi:hypothetical protein ACPW96_22420 [Micromonospora sp. DT81.3]|uniref:hypothetical protein n=1 Tax=Micromonospora sp. DT81.3 TaxID=3416523 RepID=UPI003CFB67E3
MADVWIKPAGCPFRAVQLLARDSDPVSRLNLKDPTLAEAPQSLTSAELHAALVRVLGELPPPLRRTLTWDQGTKMARHLDVTADTGTKIDLLLRRRQPVAARHEREHERPPA